MSERTSKEISEKIKDLELMMHVNPERVDIEFIQGSLSALYWITKKKNPYTGYDMAEV